MLQESKIYEGDEIDIDRKFMLYMLDNGYETEIISSLYNVHIDVSKTFYCRSGEFNVVGKWDVHPDDAGYKLDLFNMIERCVKAVNKAIGSSAICLQSCTNIDRGKMIKNMDYGIYSFNTQFIEILRDFVNCIFNSTRNRKDNND